MKDRKLDRKHRELAETRKLTKADDPEALEQARSLTYAVGEEGQEISRAVKLEKATVLPPEPVGQPVEPPTELTPLPESAKPTIREQVTKRRLDIGGIVTAAVGTVLAVAGTLVDQTPVIVDLLGGLGADATLVGQVSSILGVIGVVYAAVTRAKDAVKVVPFIMLLLLPVLASAQVTPPAKLLELESVQPPAKTTSWFVGGGYTTLYVSGTDSARVYFSNTLVDRTIIAKVGGVSYVRAGVFGWFVVSSVRLTAWNEVQDTPPGQLSPMDALDYAFTVAYHKDGPEALRSFGAAIPRGQR